VYPRSFLLSSNICCYKGTAIEGSLRSWGAEGSGEEGGDGDVEKLCTS
jgi:hypothetical protein